MICRFLCSPKFIFLYAAALMMGLVILAPDLSPIYAQQDTASPPCDTLRTLMAQNTTPYHREIGGGVLQPGAQQAVDFNAAHYADTWALNVLREQSASGVRLEGQLNITFDTISPGLHLEAALFTGMLPLPDTTENTSYRAVTAGDTLSYPLRQDGVMTLVIRRADSATTTAGNYTLTADFPGGGAVTTAPLRDNTAPAEVSTELRDGHLVFDINTTRVRTHARAVNSVSSHNGTAAQVRFESTTASAGFFVENWATDMIFIGGDLAITGTAGGRERLLFIEDYGYVVDHLRGDLTRITDSKGNTWRIDWQAITGVWITGECAGFKLDDGRTFTATLSPTARSLTFQGTLDDFAIAFIDNTPAASTAYTLAMNWPGITENSEVMFHHGVLTADLTGERHIALESSQVTLRRREDTGEVAPEHVPLDITLADRGASLTLDWVNMSALALLDNTLTFTFLESPRSTTTREGAELLRFEALDDIIQITYKNTADGSPGEQRLLLPQSESYIELVTPGGMPPFDGRSLPGEAGYAPRALNNLGGECYPINTLQPQANCPPNGYPNPANSNLWIAITDLLAYGNPFDLALTRSYNSRISGTDGPFGFGWTTQFLLDYNVLYDTNTHSRTVTTETTAAYSIGLDLTWMPRGVVTLTTASGSKHVFASPGNAYTGGELRALTMPGWTLSHAGVRAPVWTLTQDTGMWYTFDRAGRLTGYGAAYGEKTVSISYPGDLLNGVAELQDTPVILTDAASLRQLELYYDDTHHIVRSVLRDMTAETCENAVNCFETIYTYKDGFLTHVRYADGSTAVYTYDEHGRLTSHSDPRAPIAQDMTYRYGANNGLVIDIRGEDGTPFTWRQVDAPVVDSATRTVNVTDEYGRQHRYVYTQDAGTLKSTGNSFTLREETGPLDGVTAYESLPVVYEWDGAALLDRIPSRSSGNAARNSVDFTYTGLGNLSGISLGYPALSITYSGADGRELPTALQFPNNTTLQITYDSLGWVNTVTTPQGETRRYTWDDSHRLVTVVSENAGTAVDYTYNAAGLVITTTQRRLNTPTAQDYTRSYTYDGLGRLIMVDDPLTGAHTLHYAFVSVGNEKLSQTTLTDATGTVLTATQDVQGNLREQITQTQAGVVLRHMTLTYDVLRRITGEVHWLYPLTETLAGDAAPQPLSRTYTYTPIESLPALPDETNTVQVNGYAVTVTDPYGRTETYTYDALDRIVQIQDASGAFTRYAYANLTQPNGMAITRQDVQNNRVIKTTTYTFDVLWQLTGVEAGDTSWSLNYTSGTNNLWVLGSVANGIQSQQWAAYERGRPSGVGVVPRQSTPALLSGTQFPSTSLQAAYDFRGRPVQITDATGNVYLVLYCPTEQGGEQTAYYVNTGAAPPPTCAQPGIAPPVYAIWHDASGRIIRVDDANGSRAVAYTPQNDTWKVTITFDTGDTPATPLNWELHYNGAGDLTFWEDESGIQHTYLYDTLGQLRRVEVAGQPEASFTLAYNTAGQLVSVLDDLQRGTYYAYDSLGQLTSKQDARTANATTYGYNADGQLATVISPLGGSTTFLYTDPQDPTRLTTIIEPTGSAVQFDWSGAANISQYTDPRGGKTTYTFDAFGALWQIIDAANRSHEIRYNAAGFLTDWYQTYSGGSAAQNLQVTWRSPSAMEVTTAEVSDWQRTLETTANGQLAAVRGSSGGALTFTYDPSGRLTQVKSAGNTWTLAYSAGRPVLTFTDGFGLVRTLHYDALNRLVQETTDDQSTTYTYAGASRGDLDVTVDGATARIYTFIAGDSTSRYPAVEVRQQGQRTTYLYNAEGLLSEITTAACIAVDPTETFDPTRPDNCLRSGSNVWRTSERFVYDAQGRPIRHIDAEQNVETFSYDASGNLTAYQSFDGRSFVYTYDLLNRLQSITGPTGIRLFLQYDGRDLVTEICQTHSNDFATCAREGGVLETYTYDALGRLQTQTFGGDPTPVSYTYTAENDGLLAGWRKGNTPGTTLTRTNDGLALFQTASTQTSVYAFAYAALDRIQQSGDMTYTYDAYGRLASVTAGERPLTYMYAPDGRGYSITDTATGAQIRFALNENGFLSAIESGLHITYFLNPDGQILVVNIARDDGELIELQLNRRGETQSILYQNSNFFVSHVHDAAGAIQRQGISGDTDYFTLESEGYIAVIGYDNDNRPLTTRITERETGELLYLLTLTYDSLGRRETETHRYANGSQVTITGRYNTQNQLVERRFSDVDSQRPRTALSGVPLLLGFALAGWRLSLRKRRQALVIAMLLMIAAPFGLFTLLAQNTTETPLTHTYRYDEFGNLLDITAAHSTAGSAICAIFAYDGANRLIQATRDGVTQNYAYDAHNRLIQIGERSLAYHGDSATLLAVSTGTDSVRFYGQAATLPAFFLTDGETITWLLNDGRREVLTPHDSPSPISLLDPMGRVLAFESPPDLADNLCQKIDTTALTTVSPVQMFQDGMIWDAVANLYFVDGRTYAPDLGQFLQRDPLGPDVFGNVYGYPSRQATPPVVHNHPPGYTDGLYRLRDALETLNTTETLTVDQVKAAYLPALHDAMNDSLPAQLHTLAAKHQDLLLRQLDFPMWLTTQYNLPAPYVDETGALHLARDTAPGQGGQSAGTFAPSALVWNNAAVPEVRPLSARLDPFLQAATPPVTVFAVYQPFAWQPTLPTPDTLSQIRTPVTQDTPGAVDAWLPDIRQNMRDADAIADAILALIDLPERTGESWLQEALGEALPQAPNAPAEDSAAWLANWFTDDTFGVARHLQTRWPQFPATGVPVYQMGVNAR